MCHHEIGYHRADHDRAAFASALIKNDPQAIIEWANGTAGSVTVQGNYCPGCRSQTVALMAVARNHASAMVDTTLVRVLGKEAASRLFPSDKVWVPIAPAVGTLSKAEAATKGAF